jgi:parallel beta-helix repeat protein
MTVANSIISNNSGIGAYNVFPPQIPVSNTLARNSADQLSGGDPCACMTITDSVVSNNTDGIFNAAYAFPWAASLTVVNSNVSDNDHGGIRNDTSGGSASATIVSTTVSGNSAGGVLTSAFEGFAGVTITNSTISGNSTYGGIKAAGSFFLSAANLSVANSTISGNSAGDSGGGIYASAVGDCSIVNSTISDNSAGTSGGGIYNSASALHVANSTITGNSAGSGGGIYNDGLVDVSNTILNAGGSGENIFNNGGTVTSNGYNLSSDDGGGYLNGPGDQINTDPLLGPLQDNGGPTFTHALLAGSPAIDAGDPNFSPPPLNDQRGCSFDRVFNGRIDIGSFETQPPRRPCPTPRPRPTPPPRP